VTLTASPETDLAVAKACGIIAAIVSPEAGCHHVEEMTTEWTWRGLGNRFRPSTDLNDAFMAAEKHPWTDKIVVQRTKNLDWYANIGGSYEYAETPALAICAAILKLAETKSA